MHVPMSLPPNITLGCISTCHVPNAIPPWTYYVSTHHAIHSFLQCGYFLLRHTVNWVIELHGNVEVIVEGRFFPSEICSRAWCALNMPIPPKLINYFLQLDAKPHALITSPTTFAKASLTHLALYSGPSLIRIAWDQSPFRLVEFSD